MSQEIKGVPISKTGNREHALDFLKKVAEAERLSSEVQKGDVFNTVKVARSHGFDIGVQDLWDAIVELQKNRERLTQNVPSWIIDRLRVAVHD